MVKSDDEIMEILEAYDLTGLVDRYKKSDPGSVYFKDYDDPTDFFRAFKQVLQPGSKTRIVFDLKNVDGGAAGAKAWADSISSADRAANPGDNFTGWELALIQDAPADVRARVEWLNGPDPFAGG